MISSLSFAGLLVCTLALDFCFLSGDSLSWQPNDSCYKQHVANHNQSNWNQFVQFPAHYKWKPSPPQQPEKGEKCDFGTNNCTLHNLLERTWRRSFSIIHMVSKGQFLRLLWAFTCSPVEPAWLWDSQSRMATPWGWKNMGEKIFYWKNELTGFKKRPKVGGHMPTRVAGNLSDFFFVHYSGLSSHFSEGHWSVCSFLY